MKYDITVENQGNIDAVLESIEVNDGNNPAITFQTSGIEEGDELQVSQTNILTVIVSYDSNVTSQPENKESTITVTLNYKQKDGTGEITPGGETTTIGGQPVEVVDSGDGLYADEYEEGKYTYKGANPNNYITFNNETWRIISIGADNTIKIMQNESIENQVWDAGNSNDWETSDIKSYLNNTYLPTITVNNDKIVSHTWNIGGVTYNNTDLSGQIADENGTQSQSTNVGMIIASEYLRANTNKEQCGNMNTNNTNKATCLTTNWMYNIVPSGGYLWAISPLDSSSNYSFFVSGFTNFAGEVNYSLVINSPGVSPVLHLTPSITLTGDRTEGNPFQIMA